MYCGTFSSLLGPPGPQPSRRADRQNPPISPESARYQPIALRLTARCIRKRPQAIRQSPICPRNRTIHQSYVQLACTLTPSRQIVLASDHCVAKPRRIGRPSCVCARVSRQIASIRMISGPIAPQGENMNRCHPSPATANLISLNYFPTVTTAVDHPASTTIHSCAPPSRSMSAWPHCFAKSCSLCSTDSLPSSRCRWRDAQRLSSQAKSMLRRSRWLCMASSMILITAMPSRAVTGAALPKAIASHNAR